MTFSEVKATKPGSERTRLASLHIISSATTRISLMRNGYSATDNYVKAV
jgi:hypothetical protein